jgi:hypothetical protein
MDGAVVAWRRARFRRRSVQNCVQRTSPAKRARDTLGAMPDNLTQATSGTCRRRTTVRILAASCPAASACGSVSAPGTVERVRSSVTARSRAEYISDLFTSTRVLFTATPAVGHFHPLVPATSERARCVGVVGLMQTGLRPVGADRPDCARRAAATRTCLLRQFALVKERHGLRTRRPS